MKYLCAIEFLVDGGSRKPPPGHRYEIRSLLEGRIVPALERIARCRGLDPCRETVRVRCVEVYWARRDEIIAMTPRKHHLAGPKAFKAACGNWASKPYLHEALDGIEKDLRCKLCGKAPAAVAP